MIDLTGGKDDGSVEYAVRTQQWYQSECLAASKQYGPLDMRLPMDSGANFNVAPLKALEMFWRFVATERSRRRATKN